MIRRMIVVAFLVAGVVTMGVATSRAMPKFSKAFEEKYVKNSDNDDLKAAYKKAKCDTCHVKGEKKDVNNNYGQVLAELVPGSVKERLEAAKAAGATKEESDALRTAEEEKVLKELDEAFKKAEEEKSPTGDTFGQRLKAGKLPQEVVEKKKDE